MERYHNILQDEDYQGLLAKLEEYEADRIYCCHDLTHALDVARMMYIFSLEEASGLEQDVIYATALLHDIGRVAQYETQEPHHQASVRIAEGILQKYVYTQGEMSEILDAIAMHRGENQDQLLGEYLYRADKLSRNCFCCKASDTCKWPESKKNKSVVI